MRKLFIRSLSDLKNGLDFSSTWFKTLFQFGRLEGLPVKQDWLANLEQKEQDFAVFTLNTKLVEQEPKKDLVTNLVHSLRAWFNAETELRC